MIEQRLDFVWTLKFTEPDSACPCSHEHAASLAQASVDLTVRMRSSGESASTIAKALGVSRATVYRALSEAD